MNSNWPLAFLEFFVVIAFGIVYLVIDRIAKRSAEKYREPGSTDDGAPPA